MSWYGLRRRSAGTSSRADEGLRKRARPRLVGQRKGNLVHRLLPQNSTLCGPSISAVRPASSLLRPFACILQDIAEDGQVLLTSDVVNYQVGAGDSKSGHFQDLSAFEYTVLSNISDDGRMILINSFDIAVDTNYRLYVQRTDASSVLVGHGAGGNFSRDGKWVMAVDPGHAENLSVIPTGIGEARSLHATPGIITPAFPCYLTTNTLSSPQQVPSRLRRARCRILRQVRFIPSVPRIVILQPSS